MNTRSLSIAAALVISGAAAPSIQAQTLIYGLGPGNSLVTFSSVPVGGLITTSTPLTITGLGANQNIVGIDFRPFDGLLYAVARDAANAGSLYSINLQTGAATSISVVTSGTAPIGPFSIPGIVAVDFNPAANTGSNALRVETSDNQNNRLAPFATVGPTTSVNNNVDSALNFVGGTSLGSTDPSIIGTAYNNNLSGIPGGGGVGGTTQYAIDSVTNALYIQNPPNNGTLAIVGSGLGTVNPADTADGDLDIVTGTNRALATLSANGTAYGLYEINLTTGGATLLGNFSGTQVRDLAAPIPEPTIGALLAVATLALGALRRRTRA